jgi:hypothetical protein
MTQKLEVGIEFPAIDNDFVRLKCSNLGDEGRIDDAFVMVRSRCIGSVFYKHMIITREQVNIPLALNAEVFVKNLALCLPPGIKYF